MIETNVVTIDAVDVRVVNCYQNHNNFQYYVQYTTQKENYEMQWTLSFFAQNGKKDLTIKDRHGNVVAMYKDANQKLTQKRCVKDVARA